MCCGFVGKGVVEKNSASVNSCLLSLCNLPAASFFCDELRSWRGVLLGVVRLGVLLGVCVGEDMIRLAHDPGVLVQIVKY